MVRHLLSNCYAAEIIQDHGLKEINVVMQPLHRAYNVRRQDHTVLSSVKFKNGKTETGAIFC